MKFTKIINELNKIYYQVKKNKKPLTPEQKQALKILRSMIVSIEMENKKHEN